MIEFEVFQVMKPGGELAKNLQGRNIWARRQDAHRIVQEADRAWGRMPQHYRPTDPPGKTWLVARYIVTWEQSVEIYDLQTYKEKK